MNYKKEQDGGYAFPSGYDSISGSDGMTLRDYFAAVALQGFATTEYCDDPKHTAEAAYEFADSMLRERNRYR